VAFYDSVLRGLGLKRSKKDEEIAAANARIAAQNAARFQAEGRFGANAVPGAAARQLASNPGRYAAAFGSKVPQKSFLSRVADEVTGIGREFNPARQYADIAQSATDRISGVPVLGDVAKDVNQHFVQNALRPVAAVGEIVKGNQAAAWRQIDQAPISVQQREIAARGGGAAEQFFRPTVSSGAVMASYVAPAGKAAQGVKGAGTLGAPITKSSVKSLAGFGAAANTLYEGGKQLESGKANPASLAVAPVAGAVGGVAAKPVAKAGMGTLRAISPKIAGKGAQAAVNELPRLPLGTSVEPPTNVTVSTRAPGKVSEVVGVLRTGRVANPKQENMTVGSATNHVTGVFEKSPNIPKNVSPTSGVRSPEAISSDIERVIYGREPYQGVPAQNMALREKLSPDRQIRKVTSKAEEAVQGAIGKAQVSQNPLIRAAGRAATGVSTEAGRSKDVLRLRMEQRGVAEYGKIVGADIAKTAGGLSNESGTKVWSVLDPNQASKLGIKNTIKNLSPDEVARYEKLNTIRKLDTELRQTLGLIDEGQAANRDYFMRGYSLFDGEDGYQDARGGLAKQLKGVTSKRSKNVSKDTLDTAITQPERLAGKHLAETYQARAIKEYGDELAAKGLVSDVELPGYAKLPEKKFYGEAAGKYVPKTYAEDFTGFTYSMGIVQDLNSALTRYDQWGVRRARKMILTIFNPAVRLGNQIGNRIFAIMGGHNPIEYEAVRIAAKEMVAARSPEYLGAVKRGIIGTDVLMGDFQKLLTESGADENFIKDFIKWAARSYSSADDTSRFASYLLNIKKGYSPDDAARMTQRAFQDYKAVGFFYDLAAKTPIIGNPFVRFAGDMVRIIKNSTIDHPLRNLAALSIWATLVAGASKLSGESEQDRATRESSFGRPSLPLTAWLNNLLTGTNRDISLTFKVGGNEVNIGRFIPFYQLNEVQNAGSRFLPIQTNPFRNDPSKEGLSQYINPSGLQDPILGQAAQVAMNKDFRDKSINDPQNLIYDSQGNVKKYPDLPGREKAKNLARFLGVQNAPLGKEADALISAAQGKEDIYGKERTLGQAVMRAIGIKVEKYGPDQAEKQRKQDIFFDGNVARTKEFLKNNPDLESAYFTFNNPTRDRSTNVKTSELVSPERWKMVSADRSGRLFNFLKEQAYAANKENGKPIDPIFTLDEQKAREVLDLRSRPTGDDREREQILRATQPWYPLFEKAETDYYKANTALYDKQETDGAPKMNPRVKQYSEIKYPEQTPLMQEYYSIKANDQGAAKNFYKANATQLSSDFSAYKDAQLVYTNQKRAIEGFPPISHRVWNNVTFGYEDDENAVSKELYYKKKDGKINDGMVKNKVGEWVFGQSDGSPGTSSSKRSSRSRSSSRVTKIKPAKFKGTKAKRTTTSVKRVKAARSSGGGSSTIKFGRTRIQ